MNKQVKVSDLDKALAEYLKGKSGKIVDVMQEKDSKIKGGDKVKYTGKGFIGFDKNNPVAFFDKFSGQHDCYIVYNENSVLVRKYDIEKV